MLARLYAERKKFNPHRKSCSVKRSLESDFYAHAQRKLRFVSGAEMAGSFEQGGCEERLGDLNHKQSANWICANKAEVEVNLLQAGSRITPAYSIGKLQLCWYC